MNKFNQITTKLIGREKEFNRLEVLLTKVFSNENNQNRGKDQSDHDATATLTAVNSLSIYVSGPPGTGKTTTVHAVVKKLKKQQKQVRKFDKSINILMLNNVNFSAIKDQAFSTKLIYYFLILHLIEAKIK